MGSCPLPPPSPPLPTKRSPTKLCFLLSHSGAARTPLVTSAKKAFFTYSGDMEEEGDVGTPPPPRQGRVHSWPPNPPPPPTHLQGGVKDDEFGAGGDEVVAAV